MVEPNGGKRSCGRRVGGRRSLRRTVLAPNDRGAKDHEVNSWRGGGKGG